MYEVTEKLVTIVNTVHGGGGEAGDAKASPVYIVEKTGGGFKKKPEKAQQTIVLKLDNKEFGRAVVDAINKSGNMSIAT